MNDQPVGEDREVLLVALNRLQSAIQLMDQGQAPGHIAAHVDLAIHQLAETIGTEAEASPVASDSNESGTPLVS